MGNCNHSAGVVVQEALQPGDGLGVEVVGRFVQQQHVRLGEQQAAECDTAAFTTGELRDICVPGWQTQRICSDFQSTVEIMAVFGGDQIFQLGLFSG